MLDRIDGLNNPYRFVDPDGKYAWLLIPVAAAILTDNNYANAPKTSDTPTRQSASTAEFAGNVAMATLGIKGGGEIYKLGKAVESAGNAAQDLKYDPRVRARGVEDPVSHNFPYSYDKEILGQKPIPKNNGYNMFQKEGTMNGKDGVFEIGRRKDGTIDHRFFKPKK